MKKTVTLYTTSYNNYWDKHGQEWCSDVNNLSTKPDEIIIVSDAPVDLSCLNYENVKNITSPVVKGRRMVSEYRNIAVKAASSDWIVSADLDDRYKNTFLDNIPEESDIHAFNFYYQEADKLITPGSNCLNERVYGLEGNNLISSHSAIKRHVFDKLKYEDNCHEDRVFYAMASQLDLKVSSDGPHVLPRLVYMGWHTNHEELNRVTEVYIQNIINSGSSVYSFWFSKNMSENRKNALNTISKSCKTLHFLDSEGFYKFENLEIPIHKGFKYLTDNHKSDYARAYMMYFYGGGYSDLKPNEFDWTPYFKQLFSSKHDAIGYSEVRSIDVAKFYNTLDVEDYVNNNYKRFIGNGHYIFKPKTYIAYQWITQVHKKMDERYENLVNNPGQTVHILDPSYSKILEKYPFEWNELGARILHKLQYEYKFANTLHGMPYVNAINYI
jgi:hypothetical protein